MTLSWWVSAFYACIDMDIYTVAKGRKAAKVVVTRFPDGGCWLDQEAIMSDIFDIMVNETQLTVARG